MVLTAQKRPWYIRILPWHMIWDQGCMLLDLAASKTSTKLDDNAIKLMRPKGHAAIDYFIYGKADAFDNL